ncbi:recombinase family protein [Rosistilla oblonga]|uniref:recombinase family protein n=1 Tax=Rosistilla oblonga TaxID=2527990 RepID=UPI003A96AE86
MTQHIAIYARVSSKKQDTRSQQADLDQWIAAFAKDQTIKWYKDKFTGKTMDRPGWKRLEADMTAGKLSKVVVWRMDRLGRTASGLTALFEEFQRLGVGFESLRDKVDLSTAAGRLLANVLASVSAYENEVRSERVLAGQHAARAAGKTWGGSEKGRRLTVTDEQIATVRRMQADGESKAAMARATGLSRPTVYSILAAS